jgi:hypothetical protein
MGRAGMVVMESEVPELVRRRYATLRPEWKVLDISLVARKFGGFMAVVACEKAAAPASEGVSRFADEICYVSRKGEVTCFTDIASFANFLIWYERRPARSKWLTPALFFRCLYIVGLIAAVFSLDAALEAGSTILAIVSVVPVVSFASLMIFQPRE